MPSAPKIRKELLHILESSILPTLRQQQEILQVLAAPPFDFSQVQPQAVREEFLPDNDEGPLQVLRSWPEENMVAMRGTNPDMTLILFNGHTVSGGDWYFADQLSSSCGFR